VAQEKGYIEIEKLLKSSTRPTYKRQTEPELPMETDEDSALQKQAEIASASGLVFPTEPLR
jgi:hypothetical protein